MRKFVLFYSSFRRPGAMNITHETIDGIKTLCGRVVDKDAQVEPDDRDDVEPDCLACARALEARRRRA